MTDLAIDRRYTPSRLTLRLALRDTVGVASEICSELPARR
jgi:hypothetical protein